MRSQKLRLPRTAEEKWELAIARWEKGDDDAVDALLRGEDDAIPAFARSFLADERTGKIKRRRGPKKKNESVARVASDIQSRLRILNHYALVEISESVAKHLRKDRSGSPRDRAIERTAEELRESESRVRLVVRDAWPSKSGRRSRDS